MALGFFDSSDDPLSYEGAQRKRKIAEALMQQGMSTAPIQSWTEGAARLAQALVGKMQADKVDKADASNSKLLASLLSGGSAPSTSAPSPASGAAPTPSTAMTTADATGQPNYRDAIASIESRGSGDYSAVGPTHPKYGRALGRYQVMESNIGPWSEAALGRRVTPEEFLQNKDIQDKIFDHQFGSYVQKYGNPQDAASAWFTGRPLAQGANARDSLGTTGAGYVEKFNAALAGGAPVQVAQAGGATAYAPQALAQALNPQARAPQAQPSPQMAQAAPQQGAPDMARLQGILMDPRFSPQQKQMALQMFQLGQKDTRVSPVDLGDRIALVNAQGQVSGYLPKERGKTFGPIGQDQYGNNQYGFIDQRAGTVTPVPLPGSAPTTPAPAPSTPSGGVEQSPLSPPTQPAPPMPPPPPGVNPKIWRDEQTRELVRGGPKMTEGESNANAFVNRMIEADRVLNKYEGEGTSQFNNIAGKIPMIGNRLVGEGAQLYDQAKRAFVNSVLRKESGATITPEEFANADKQYFPQPGDGPRVIAQKRAARQTAIEGMKASAGKGFKEVVQKQPEFSGESDWQEIDGVKIRRVK